MTKRIFMHLPGLLVLAACAVAIVYYLVQGTLLGSVPLTFIVIFAALIIIAMLISDQQSTKPIQHDPNNEKQEMLARDLELRMDEIRKENTARLEESNRLAEFGKISAGLFHDLLNPLTTLSNNIEQLGKGVSEQHLAELSHHSTEAAKRIRHVLASVKEILFLDSAATTFNLNQAVREAVSLFAYTLRITNIETEIAIPETLQISGRRDIFLQIMMNLISNSIEAMTGRSGAKLLGVRSHTSTSFVWIHVSDNGGGISTQIKEKIGNTPITTKKSGVGIGLYQCKRLIESEFRGEMAIESTENKGTIVSIKIPLQET